MSKPFYQWQKNMITRNEKKITNLANHEVKESCVSFTFSFSLLSLSAVLVHQLPFFSLHFSLFRRPCYSFVHTNHHIFSIPLSLPFSTSFLTSSSQHAICLLISCFFASWDLLHYSWSNFLTSLHICLSSFPSRSSYAPPFVSSFKFILRQYSPSYRFAMLSFLSSPSRFLLRHIKQSRALMYHRLTL